MSTDYFFVCRRCNEYGGFYSRQAGGWGNARFIDSFKFVMKHTSCGTHHIGVECEDGLRDCIDIDGYKENKERYDRYNPHDEYLYDYVARYLMIRNAGKDTK